MNDQKHWVSVWGNAVSVAENRPERYAKDITIRYPIHIPFGGSAVRLTFDNYCGTEPVTLNKTTVFYGGAFYPVTFGGNREVTIPAGASVNLAAKLTKQASFDYHCAGTENRGVSGYDAVTALGSNLTFTSQSAKLEDREQIAIVRENFGFDLENGITEVELDLATEHYYLEVKRSEA